MRVGLVACIALALGACTTIPFASVPTGSPIDVRLLPLHAAPDPISGGRIVDSAGREVLLRGVNVNALVEYWQYGAFPTTFPLTTVDAERIAGVGWNSVRLLVSWSRIEPAPGRYDDAYLDRVGRCRSAPRPLRHLVDRRLPPGRVGPDARGSTR